MKSTHVYGAHPHWLSKSSKIYLFFRISSKQNASANHEAFQGQTGQYDMSTENIVS